MGKTDVFAIQITVSLGLKLNIEFDNYLRVADARLDGCPLCARAAHRHHPDLSVMQQKYVLWGAAVDIRTGPCGQSPGEAPAKPVNEYAAVVAQGTEVHKLAIVHAGNHSADTGVQHAFYLTVVPSVGGQCAHQLRACRMRNERKKYQDRV
jgi:hypothetical protein